MILILTYEEAVCLGFGIWLGWKALQASIRYGWEALLIYRWKRRAWPRRIERGTR